MFDWLHDLLFKEPDYTGQHQWTPWSILADSDIPYHSLFGPSARQRRRCLTCGLTQECSITYISPIECTAQDGR